MPNIPVLAFAGYSGSGKTTLIEKLLPCLRARGLRVAVIKHDGHDFQIDHPGKDTHRFSQAGAELSLITSPTKTACVLQRPLSLGQVLAQLREVDLVLVEGWKQEPLPQIGLARRGNGKGFTAPLSRFTALVTDLEVDTALPCFGFDDTEALAAFIQEDFMTRASEDFTHFNSGGQPRMVDVGEKAPSRRRAVAAGRVLVSPETLALIRSGGMKKGDVLTVAQIAGIMGAKRTPELIPMCHPILLDGIDLSLRLDETRCSVEIEAAVSCDGRTGVEMEALTAVSAAALTVYDMCKAVQKDMVITDVRLLRKSGGVHGDFEREDCI